MSRRTREDDPWDEALVELLDQQARGIRPPHGEPEAQHSVGGWLLGRDPATLPPYLPMRPTLVLAGAWFVLLPLVVAAPTQGDRATWAWVLLGVGVAGVLTTLAALVGRWRTAPVWSATGALPLLVSGAAAGAAPGPLGATAVLLALSVWGWSVARRPRAR